MITETDEKKLNTFMSSLNKVANEVLNKEYSQNTPKNSFYYYSDEQTKNKYFYTTSKRLKNKDSKRIGYISGVYVYLKSKKHFKARAKKTHAKKKDAIARALMLSKTNLFIRKVLNEVY